MQVDVVLRRQRNGGDLACRRTNTEGNQRDRDADHNDQGDGDEEAPPESKAGTFPDATRGDGAEGAGHDVAQTCPDEEPAELAGQVKVERVPTRRVGEGPVGQGRVRHRGDDTQGSGVNAANECTKNDHQPPGKALSRVRLPPLPSGRRRRPGGIGLPCDGWRPAIRGLRPPRGSNPTTRPRVQLVTVRHICSLWEAVASLGRRPVGLPRDHQPTTLAMRRYLPPRFAATVTGCHPPGPTSWAWH